MEERIKNLEGYFEEFNITEGIIYVKVKFPNKWQIPDSALLTEHFAVKVANDSDKKYSYYFFGELGNGVENVFDAIDFTIMFNKDIEEKTTLLTQKVNELKDLFASRTLDELKNLKIEIVYNKTEEKKTRKKGGKKLKEEIKKDEIINEVHEEVLTHSQLEGKVDVNKEESDSLLSFATALADSNLETSVNSEIMEGELHPHK